MKLSLDKNVIMQMLEELKRKDPQFNNFGANVHRYNLNIPLDLIETESFESKYNISLPIDYKYFITEVGNGGAGPYYGLFRFGEQDDGHGYCTWDEGFLVGDLSAEFPHMKAWNLPESFWEKMPDPEPDISEEEEDRLMEAWDKELEEHYWNQKIMNGAIPICHEGCAYRQWLIINGKQKGYVWSDARADDAGISPVLDEQGNQVTFSDWYMSWLQNPLKV